ncbi:hypothetical protein PTQ27_03495 [Mannheimia sp. AT1]|uniref:Uncharacterized protein n=1 Tax=Mannheimia cairinae TaxID=3025936 RepID=A0ABT5MRN9_9PAST|nr:hypothetical protein [Mannheimia cairinae]MDD0823537.1 hypothetical protein [Mannheimia cairinae]MDD0826750.1 hypothetical protein [Mannheimia cairinae]
MSTLFSFFYIYDPWFFHFFRMAFFVGLIAAVMMLIKLYRNEFKAGISIPLDSLYAILGLLVISVIPMLIYRSNDFSVVTMYSKLLILFGFGVIGYNLFYRQQNSQQKLIADLKIGIVIQWIVGVAALLGLPFMVDFALSSNVNMPRFFGSEQEYRLYNITSAAFFQLSIFFLFLLHFLLAYNEKHNNISSVFLFFILCIGLISGRTFLLLSVVSILLYFKWRYLPVLFIFAGMILLLAMYLPDNRYVAHALEPLINLLTMVDKSLIHSVNEVTEATQLSSSTDTLLEEHLYMPQLKQILFGDGFYFTEDGRYYGFTDSGFIRQVLYGGIGYMLACFAFTAYFVWKVAQNWFNGSWKFTLSTLAILSICNIKADTYAFPGIMFVLIIFLSLFVEKNENTSGRNLILFCKQKDAKNV